MRSPRHVVTVGKTPALEAADARALFASLDPASPNGVRDRALLGVMVYTFARISAVLALDVGEYYQAGIRCKHFYDLHRLPLGARAVSLTGSVQTESSLVRVGRGTRIVTPGASSSSSGISRQFVGSSQRSV